MKLIVGLGNPGPQYELTKHNVGFRVIDKLAQSLKTDFINWRSIGLIIKTQDYILAKPLTYMNQSGLLVSELVKFYKINIDDILIVYDDMDFNVGQAIMRTNGSSAGHNGLKDIFRMLQTQEIKRLKIGISRDKNSKNYVLTPFDPIQEAIIKKVIELFNFDDLLGLRFRININSFYQVNKEVAQHAYQRIIDFVQEGDFVLDLYSGIGTISLLVAQKAKKVIAVEENKFAHKDALFNQKINKINNVSFKNKEVFEFLKDFDDLVDTIIVDPAREGVQKAAIKEILRLNPKRIIYLSCNPATQAYDFSLLKHKYKIIFFEIHNMFVKTFHIENLICLERK